jgi:hypothetical protein
MGATPKKTKAGTRIVPAKVVFPKAKKRRAGAVGTANCCDLICPTPSQMGFLVCTANGIGLIVPPQTGGPWSPAINPVNGTFIFINAAQA